MWALPARSTVACGEDGVEGGEDLLRFAEGGVEGGLVACFEGLEVDGGYGFFDFGEEVFARGGERGQDVGGGDALDADVFRVGAGAGAGSVGVGFDLEVDAGEGFFVDGVEEFDGYEDLVAGLGGVEEDDGFEVVAEGYAAAVEVDDLGHGAVGVGAELEPDAGAGEVVAVEGLGDFDDAAVPDGVLGGFGAGLLTRGQEESSRVGDSPWGMSPAWKRHSPAGRELSISRVWSFAIAAGERFFCSRMGVKDWAKAMEQVSANASGRCLGCMGARVANSGVEKCGCSEKGLRGRERGSGGFGMLADVV